MDGLRTVVYWAIFAVINLLIILYMVPWLSSMIGGDFGWTVWLVYAPLALYSVLLVAKATKKA